MTTERVSYVTWVGEIYDRWRVWIHGPPVVVPCVIDLDGRTMGGYVWKCTAHWFGFNERRTLLDGRLDDRCPISRLEEWRKRRWETSQAV